ncbi:MAG: hypothetical protein J6125_00655 [Clostridia bacterium]|nr:hypothetical protein [Clostridia bacterium]
MLASADLDTFIAPLTYPALETETRRLAAACPSLRVCTLGYSVCGRRIPYYIYGRGRRVALYVAAHHASEWLTGTLLLAFARDLIGQGTPESGVCYVIVPMLNPDGVELALGGPDPRHPLCARQLRMNGGSADFSHWQANARGVDLNHNYSVGFSAYARLHPGGEEGGAPTLWPGPYPESEPETAALVGLIRLLRPSIILTLHTQGEEIYYSRAEATPSMHRMAAELERLTGYVAADATGTAAYGGLTEWAVRCGLPCFTLECGKGQNPLPPASAPDVYARLAPALFAAPALSYL